jgi:hypothetical protein
MSEPLVTTKTNGLSSFIQNLSHCFFAPRKSVFDFTDREAGVDYFFESIGQGNQGCLVIQCESIKPGVHVLLCIEDVIQRYEVREVSFYASPPDMCTALLVGIGKP